MDINSIVTTQSCLSSLEEEIRDETKQEEHKQLLDSAPSENDPAQSQPTLIIKNLAQMLELKALERMLTTIYSSTKPLTLVDLLEKIQCDNTTINLLKHLAFAPLCTGLLQGLKQGLTITDEGKRLFEISQIYFGFYGHTGSSFSHSFSSNTAISVKLKLSAAEVKQATIRLKARLQAPAIRQLIEQILREELAIFKSSGLCQAMLQQRQSFIPMGPTEGQWTVSTKISAEIEIPRLVQKTLWALTADKTVNIVGGTGTGKTSIASEVALKLSQGQKVLLVTHSRLLAAQLRFQYEQYLRDQETKRKIYFEPVSTLNQDGANAKQGSLTISTFHALCHSAALAANLNPPKFRSTKVFNEIFPELLLEANRLYPALKFDAIVVDEGHSFGTNLWRALKHSLNDPAKGIFVFCYDPQLLAFNRNSVVPHAATTIDLKVSFKSNLDLLASNETTELYEVSSVEEQTDAVQFIVDSLLSTGQYRPNDLAILSACSDKSHKFKFAGGIKVSQQPVKPSARAALLETSLFQFRALTAKVVILIDLFDEVDKLSDWKFKYFCYLVWGRATEKLIIVGREEAMTRLLPREITTLATAEILPGKGRKP